MFNSISSLHSIESVLLHETIGCKLAIIVDEVLRSATEKWNLFLVVLRIETSYGKKRAHFDRTELLRSEYSKDATEQG